jgi:hypothetical protein
MDSNRYSVQCIRIRKLKRDLKGGLEGMPLQLLIIVVVAVMALGMIMYWMGSINEPPKSIKVISVEVDENDEDIDLSNGNPDLIAVTVYDQDLSRVDGAVVTLDGCGFDQVSAKTGSDLAESGTAVFDGKDVDLPPGIKTGEITVTAKKAGYAAKTTSILVYFSS